MAYLESRHSLDTFMEQHGEIFNVLHEIIEDVNTKRQAADKAVRAAGVSCGPWNIGQTQTVYNADALYEGLGRDGFLAVGGKLSTKTVVSVDKNKVNAAVTRGDIPKPLAEHVITERPRYTAPKDIVL
jgi:hypothetical protein